MEMLGVERPCRRWGAFGRVFIDELVCDVSGRAGSKLGFCDQDALDDLAAGEPCPATWELSRGDTTAGGDAQRMGVQMDGQAESLALLLEGRRKMGCCRDGQVPPVLADQECDSVVGPRVSVQ
jgi:hypothetical protein